MIRFDTSPQGSDDWLEARRGAITGSRCKDARDKLKSGEPSKAALLYAMDTARERCGGRVLGQYVNGAMRMGTEQEPRAREAYEAHTGALVLEAGFASTEDRHFGCSVDGLVDDDGIVEIKTMVSSDTLFRAVVDRDISAYTDQINMALWLLSRRWCDLILWAPDLEHIGRQLTIIRINRSEPTIEDLERDLLAFDARVSMLESRLRATA